MQRTNPKVMQDLCRRCDEKNTTVWKETKDGIKEIFERTKTKVQTIYNEVKNETYKPRGFKI